MNLSLLISRLIYIIPFLRSKHHSRKILVFLQSSVLSLRSFLIPVFFSFPLFCNPPFRNRPLPVQKPAECCLFPSVWIAENLWD